MRKRIFALADIVLIKPRSYLAYWGFDSALPFFRKKLVLTPLNLLSRAALTPVRRDWMREMVIELR